MTPAEHLEKIARKIFSDVRESGLALDHAWTLNEYCELQDALKNSHEASGANLVFRALWERSVFCLLRVLDSQRKTYSINNFLVICTEKKYYNALIEEVISWPMIETQKEAEYEIGRTINRVTRIRDSLNPIVKKFNKLRNTSLIHNHLEMEVILPTFNDLFEIVSILETISENILRVSTGEIADIFEFRRIFRKDSKVFWRTMLYGTKHESNDRSPDR